MLFTRKYEHLPILVRIGSNVLPQTTYFKYFGIFFDSGLQWSCHVKYVRRRCPQRVNLLKSVASVSWGAHPSCDSLDRSWNMARFGKGSVPIIEDLLQIIRLGHPLRERLEVLGALNMGHCIGGYSNVLSLDIVPSESFTRHELPALLRTPLVYIWTYGKETC
jgi:hypothetical protein